MWLGTGVFLAGLMVQSHPLSVVLVVALVVWHFVRCPPAEWVKRLEVYVAAVAFGIGYAPMLWILTGRPDQVIGAVQKQSYVYGPVESIGQYMDRLVSALTLLVTTIAGTGERLWACLLYTSDAADERSSVDLGGRRIIKKKIKTTNSVTRAM